jgi:hypothetical protein
MLLFDVSPKRRIRAIIGFSIVRPDGHADGMIPAGIDKDLIPGHREF